MTQTVVLAPGTVITWLDVVDVIETELRGDRIFVWAKVRTPSGAITDLTVEGRWRTALVTDQSGRAVYMPSLTFEIRDPEPARPS